MDFRDTDTEAAFRAEASEWIDAHLVHLPFPRPRSHEEKVENSRWWQSELAAGGWVGLTWPTEYGGRGLTIVHEAIFNAETARRDAPAPINLLGTLLAGPTILVHGTEAQKEFFLPRILSGEDVWCQGFSEPGAGSDLAGLRSRATPTDDGWVVNGQKVWTSYAHAANRCMFLARTGGEESGKHGGITYFLADMDDAEVRPLVMINGSKDFNEVFFDDVHVPADRVLGDVGGGWPVALTTLAFERGSLAFALAAMADAALDRLSVRVRDAGLATDAGIQEEIGSIAADVEGLRITTVRQMSLLSKGQAPGAEGSAVKLAWARTMQRLTLLGVRVGAEGGAAADDEEDAAWLSGYLRARGNSVEGGTDEIQRSIIAERVLGLPRSR